MSHRVVGMQVVGMHLVVGMQDLESLGMQVVGMQETLVHMLSPTPKTVPQRSHVVAWSVLNLHNTHFLQELLKCNTNDVPARLHICECTKEKAYHCNALLHNNIMT